jgi:hypothetical protein
VLWGVGGNRQGPSWLRALAEGRRDSDCQGHAQHCCTARHFSAVCLSVRIEAHAMCVMLAPCVCGRKGDQKGGPCPTDSGVEQLPAC